MRFVELIFILVFASVVVINLARRLIVSGTGNRAGSTRSRTSGYPEVDESSADGEQSGSPHEGVPAGGPAAAIQDTVPPAEVRVEERVSPGALPIHDAGRETGRRLITTALSPAEDYRRQRCGPGGRGWENIRRLPLLKKAVILTELLGRPRGFPDHGGDFW